MVRLVFEDVTLTRQGAAIRMQVRFRGGATRVVDVAAPRPAYELYRTPAELVTALDDLLDAHGDQECAQILNERGIRTSHARRLTRLGVLRIRQAYGLRSYAERLRAVGLLTTQEVAAQFGVDIQTVQKWRRRGVLKARPSHALKDHWLFEVPPEGVPARNQHKRRWLAAQASPADAATAAGATSAAQTVLRNTLEDGERP